MKNRLHIVQTKMKFINILEAKVNTVGKIWSNSQKSKVFFKKSLLCK